MAIPTTDTFSLEGRFTETLNGLTPYSLTVVITNQIDGCAIEESGANVPNAIALSLVIGSENPIGPGTYGMGNSTATAGALVVYQKQDFKCDPNGTDIGASGAVTLTKVDSNGVVGTFDVTMQTGDRLSGSFDAPSCASLAMDSGATSAATGSDSGCSQ